LEEVVGVALPLQLSVGLEHGLQVGLHREGRSVHPAQVVGSHVVPLCFDLVVSSPQEVPAKILVERGQRTLSDLLDLGMVEEGRVAGALALLDADLLRLHFAEGPQNLGGSVEVSAHAIG